MATKLIKAVNPEELLLKLSKIEESDEEDRVWWLHGEPFRENGYHYQWLRDEPSSSHTITVTHKVDLKNFEAIIEKAQEMDK